MRKLNEYSTVFDTYDNIDFKDKVVGSSTPSKDGINPALLKDIQRAAKNAGIKVDVTTAVSGHGTSKPTRHSSGNAVDIAIINGKAVSNSNRKDADNFVDELVKMGYVKNKEVGNPKAVLTFGFPKHDNHVHVSNTTNTPTEVEDTKIGQSSDDPESFDMSSFSSTLSPSSDTREFKDKGFFSILKSLGGIGGLSVMEEINDIYDNLFEIKNDFSMNILIENEHKFGKDAYTSYGDIFIPKEKNNIIKSPVNGVIHNIGYHADCETDVITIMVDNNRYLKFCGVENIEVSQGDEVNIGEKLGTLKSDVKVTFSDKSGNKLSFSKLFDDKIEKEKNKEKEPSIDKEVRFKDPLFMGALRAPFKLLKGKKNKEGKYEKRWASPTEKNQPEPWLNKLSPTKKSEKVNENIERIKKLLK
jgi:hypothetical protein